MPVEPARVTIDPRRYSWCPIPDLPGVCQVPGCGDRWALEKHHIVPRSRTGGPVDYVTIDGLVTVNVCKLCRKHHHELTSPVGGHQAAIRFVPGMPWAWCAPFRAREGCRLTDDDMAWLSVSPASVGSLFRTARGGVWQVVGPMVEGGSDV